MVKDYNIVAAENGWEFANDVDDTKHTTIPCTVA